MNCGVKELFEQARVRQPDFADATSYESNPWNLATTWINLITAQKGEARKTAYKQLQYVVYSLLATEYGFEPGQLEKLVRRFVPLHIPIDSD